MAQGGTQVRGRRRGEVSLLSVLGASCWPREVDEITAEIENDKITVRDAGPCGTEHNLMDGLQPAEGGRALGIARMLLGAPSSRGLGGTAEALLFNARVSRHASQEGRAKGACPTRTEADPVEAALCLHAKDVEAALGPRKGGPSGRAREQYAAVLGPALRGLLDEHVRKEWPPTGLGSSTCTH